MQILWEHAIARGGNPLETMHAVRENELMRENGTEQNTVKSKIPRNVINQFMRALGWDAQSKERVK